ncbi:MAG: phosphatase PAP2 family protein [Candidatus Dormibacteria bacterium]
MRHTATPAVMGDTATPAVVGDTATSAAVVDIGCGGARVNAFRELPLVYGAMAGYAVSSISLMAGRQVGITTGHVVLVGIVVLAAAVRARQVVWEWMPFVFLLAMFQDLAGVASAVSGIVHPALAVVVEKGILGGAIAASWLQDHLRGLPGMSFIAVALVVQYLINDIVPLIVGLWLWFRHRERFRPFVAAYVLVMSIGFLIYLLFPEMPPWAAAPHVERIVVRTLQEVAGGLGTFYAASDPEPNAAMPSIHVAIPTVVACMVVKHRGAGSPLSWIALAYAATICFGVVYLGEHFVLDGIAGIALGVGCYAVVEYSGRPGTLLERSLRSARHRFGGVLPGMR